MFITVGECLDTLRMVFSDVLDGKFTAAAVTDPDNFGKLFVALDKAFSQVNYLSILDTVQRG